MIGQAYEGVLRSWIAGSFSGCIHSVIARWVAEGTSQANKKMEGTRANTSLDLPNTLVVECIRDIQLPLNFQRLSETLRVV